MSLTNLIRWILLLFYLALSFPLGVFAAWFLFRAQTWIGVGLSVLTLLGIEYSHSFY